MKEVAIRITRTLRIWNTTLTQEIFWLLVNASRRCSEVCFIRCTILTKTECDFGNIDDCKIEKFSLKETGNPLQSNWEKYPKRLTNIIDGILKCQGLRNSLKEIDINHLSKLIKVETLKKYTSIKIVNDTILHIIS